MGPVEIAVFSFPGSQFNGQVAPALRELMEAETVRVLDLAFVMKAEDGSVAWVEIEDAAMMDGFSRWQAHFRVTVPLMVRLRSFQ